MYPLPGYVFDISFQSAVPPVVTAPKPPKNLPVEVMLEYVTLSVVLTFWFIK